MAFKDLETKRSLRKKYRDSKDQLKYTQKSLASTEQERDKPDVLFHSCILQPYMLPKERKTQNWSASSKPLKRLNPKYSILNVWG